jgi:exosortase E/protease (VPEID-CTERM system)
MSASPAIPHHLDSTPSLGLPIRRWASLLALLLVELLALSLRFDGSTVPLGAGWWSALLRHSGSVSRVGIVVATAIWLSCGDRLWSDLLGLAARLRAPANLGPLLAGHLAAVAALVPLSAVVFEGRAGGVSDSGPWVLAWAVAAVTAALFWLACAVPLPLLGALAWRRSLPLLLAAGLGVLGWEAGRLTGLLWRPLGWMTLQVARAILFLFGCNIGYRPQSLTILAPSFEVTISAECSGFEGMGLILALLGAYLWLYRRDLRFPQALWLLPAGALISWTLNAVRIAALVLIGTRFSPEVAVGGFHSQAGWIAFNAIGIGLIIASRRLRVFSAVASERDDEVGPSPTVAYLMPMLAITAAAVLTGALTSGFDWLYPLRVPAAVLALWAFRRNYERPLLTWSWPAVAAGVVVFALWMALEPLGADASAGVRLSSDVAGQSRLGAMVWILARIVGSTFTVPLAEELAFRGYLLRRLTATDFTAVSPRTWSWVAFVLSSAIFGLLHGRWLAGTLAGMVYALAYRRRGVLGDAVLAHAVTNALIAALVLTNGAWALWA